MSSLKSCVALCRMELDIESSVQDIWLMRRAYDAMRKFNNPEIHIKKVIHCPVNADGRIKLPDDFYQLIVIKTKSDYNGKYEHHDEEYRYYMDVPFISNFGSLHGHHNLGSFQINGEFIQFNGDFSCIQNVDMCYLAYQTDENGICVPDSYEECIMYFLCYRYAVKKHWPASIIQDYQGNYNACFNKLQGDAQMKYFERVRPQIMQSFNSLVHRKDIYITA